MDGIEEYHDDMHENCTYMDDWGPSYTPENGGMTEVPIEDDEGPSRLFIASLLGMFLLFIICIVLYGYIACYFGVIR